MSCKEPCSLRSKNRRALPRSPAVGIWRAHSPPESPAETSPQSTGDSSRQPCILGGDESGSELFSRGPGCLILRQVQLRRLELNSGYHSYYFTYKWKIQLLGLLWGPSLSNINTKNPSKSANTSKTHNFHLTHVRWDLALCRSLPVQTGILSEKSLVTPLMCAYLLLCTSVGKEIAPFPSCRSICLANQASAYSLLICREMESEKLKLISTTNIVTEHHRAVSGLWSIRTLLPGGLDAVWKHVRLVGPNGCAEYELPNAALPCPNFVQKALWVPLTEKQHQHLFKSTSPTFGLKLDRTQRHVLGKTWHVKHPSPSLGKSFPLLTRVGLRPRGGHSVYKSVFIILCSSPDLRWPMHSTSCWKLLHWAWGDIKGMKHLLLQNLDSDTGEVQNKTHLPLMQQVSPSHPNFRITSLTAAEIVILWNKRDQNLVPLKSLAKAMKSKFWP